MAAGRDELVVSIDKMIDGDVPRSELIPCLEKSETKAVRIAIPADGPSFPIDPSLRIETRQPHRDGAVDDVLTACEGGSIAWTKGRRRHRW
jgi:hypothetical protein